jgi:hypothetical protein
LNENSKAIRFINKLKLDDRVNLEITDVVGLDITKSFWGGVKDDCHFHYKEVIIHGEVL